MAITLKAYRALFPRLYTRKTLSAKPGSVFEALKFPVMRVMGPFWSFGLNVAKVAAQDEAGVDDETFLRLSLLQEAAQGADAEDGLPGPHYFKGHHRPQLMQVAFSSFYSYDSLKKPLFPSASKGEYPSASRLSILAIHSITSENIPIGQLKDFAPVVDGQPTGPEQRDILVAAIGDLLENTPNKAVHLPACQLISGQIAFRTTLKYLKKVREELGLRDDIPEHPETDDRAVMYALPDGFAVYGALDVPWQDMPVAGWYKVTAEPGAGGIVTKRLVVWTDGPPLKPIDGMTDWDAAVGNLRALLFSQPDANAPQWLQIGENARLGADDFFWELEPKHDFDFLVHRHATPDARVNLRDTALAARLSYRPTAHAALSVMTITPPHFALSRKADNLILETPSEAAMADKTALATYAYAHKGEDPADESLGVGPNDALELALPLTETAARLRAAQQMDDPGLDEIGLLWTFFALDNGWLHAPLPNATLGNLNRYLRTPGIEQTGEQTVEATPVPEGAAKTSGALGFQNHPEAPGFNSGERAWAFTLSDVADARLRITYDRAQERIATATINLHGGTVVFEGALQTTPFRQTPERLLPDHAERALAGQTLRALSPSLLRGVERRVWNTLTDDKGLRLSMTFSKLRFRPLPPAPADQPPRKGVTPSGGVALKFLMRGNAFETVRGARQPWLWCRQDHVPTVQTLPLALAGNARSAASGSRELAPLQQTAPAPPDMVLRFEQALNMARQAPVLITNDRWQRPTRQDRWLDEIGMTLLALPSVTAFPGVADTGDPARLNLDGFRWGGGVDSPTEFEFRHDLAILDESFASAVLPRGAKEDDSPDAAPKPPAATFLPQPDNGPGIGSVTAWAEVWQQLQRDQALAASEGREMLRLSGKDIRLAGLFGDVSHKVALTPFDMIIDISTIDTGHSFQVGKPVQQSLLSVGGYGFDFEDGTDPVRRDGLPAEDDLVGFSGTLATGRTEPVDFGTAAIDAADGVFRDQRGLTSLPPRRGANLTLRRVVVGFDGAADRPAVLATAEQPYRSAADDGAPGLEFWFADLPLTADATALHPGALQMSGAPDVTGLANASAYAQSHLQGFRWYLGPAGGVKAAGRGWIVAEGVRFRPLSLTSVTLRDGVLSEARVRGRPFLSMPDVTAEPRGSDGALDLTLSIEDGKITRAVLTDPLRDPRPVRWPLALSATSDQPVPILELTTWPGTEDPAAANGVLRYILGGQARSDPVKAMFSAGKSALSVWLAETATPAPEFDGLWLAELDLLLVPGEDGALAPKTAALKLKVRLGTAKRDRDWTAELTLTRDLLNPDVPPRLVAGTLDFDAIGPVVIRAVRNGHNRQQLAFDGTSLHLRWTGEAHEQRLFDAFALSSLNGILSLALAPPVGRDAFFRAADTMLEAVTTLTTHAARHADTQLLRLVRTRADAAFRLYGALAVPNLFRWPDIAGLPETPRGWTRLALAADAPVAVTHTATIRFEGQPLHKAPKTVLQIAARVDHRLDWDGNAGPHSCGWPMFQVVRLHSLAWLRKEISDHGDNTPNWKVAPLSTFGVKGTAALALKDEFAADYLYHEDVARHAALTHELRKAFLTVTEDLTALVVDLSAHHQLDWTGAADAARNWALLGLPHLSVLDAEAPWTPPDELEAMLSSHLAQDETIWVHEADLPLSNRLQRPSEPLLAAAQKRTASRIAAAGGDLGKAPAFALALPGLVDRGNEAPGSSAHHRPVFQSFSLIERDGDPELLARHYPALHQAVVLAVLRLRAPAENPRGFSFAAARADSPLADPEGTYSEATMDRHLDGYETRRLGHLIAIPGKRDSAEPVVPPGVMVGGTRAHRLTLLAASRDGTHLRLIAQADSPDDGIDDEKQSFRDLRWAEQALNRLAPWARHGALIRVAIGDTAYPARDHLLVPEAGAEASLPGTSARPDKAVQIRPPEPPQPQQIAPPQFGAPTALPARLAEGFRPARSNAALWASENAVIPGGLTEGARLTATASEITWQLDGGAGAHLGRGDSGEVFRLTERSRIAFREARAWNSDAKTPQRLTTALPEAYHAALPSALIPAADPPRHMKRPAGPQAQPVLPAVTLSARLSARPGVWSESRAGIALASDAGSGGSGAQVPVNLRAPRPPLLALNDRTRASSHETGHVQITASPSLIIHGPRAARAGSGAEAEGLSRAPRSAFATEVIVANPAQGLIALNWDGAIRFEEGATATAERWIILRAEARLGARRFIGLPTSGALQDGAQDFVHTGADGTPVPLRNAAAAAGPAMPVHVTFELVYNPATGDAQVVLFRKLRLNLVTAGQGLGLAERPVYARFDDPEYNDRLSGIAKLEKVPAPSADPGELVFAADRSDLRIDDRLELALGLRPVPVSGPQPVFTPGGDKEVKLNGKPITMRIERHRVFDGKPMTMTYADGLLQWQEASREPIPTLAQPVEIANLHPEQGADGTPPLLPDDQLVFIVLREGRKLISLTFDVVETPLYPINPSRLAQLRLTGSGPDAKPDAARLSVPLFAGSPPADLIEIVDPRDLLDGLVRRRAVYLWRSFAPRVGAAKFALQKVAASGATWIEPNLTEGWKTLDPDAAV